jgi:hypothetical protein
MGIKRIASVSILGFSTVLYAAACWGEELTWRAVWQINKAETLDVGDRAGHALGLGQADGLAFFENDEVATVVTTFINDLTGGSGVGKTYAVHRFEDDSTLVVTFSPAVTADAETAGAAFQGSFVFASGTGRYAGISGNGSFSGRRFGGMSAPAQVYFDFKGIYQRPVP